MSVTFASYDFTISVVEAAFCPFLGATGGYPEGKNFNL